TARHSKLSNKSRVVATSAEQQRLRTPQCSNSNDVHHFMEHDTIEAVGGDEIVDVIDIDPHHADDGEAVAARSGWNARRSTSASHVARPRASENFSRPIDRCDCRVDDQVVNDFIDDNAGCSARVEGNSCTSSLEWNIDIRELADDGRANARCRIN